MNDEKNSSCENFFICPRQIRILKVFPFIYKNNFRILIFKTRKLLMGESFQILQVDNKKSTFVFLRNHYNSSEFGIIKYFGNFINRSVLNHNENEKSTYLLA